MAKDIGESAYRKRTLQSDNNSGCRDYILLGLLALAAMIIGGIWLICNDIVDYFRLTPTKKNKNSLWLTLGYAIQAIWKTNKKLRYIMIQKMSGSLGIRLFPLHTVSFLPISMDTMNSMIQTNSTIGVRVLLKILLGTW